MKTQSKTLHILLALLITVSAVVLTGHNYSHAQSDITSCQLCVHHGNSGSAIQPHVETFFSGPALDTFIQRQQLAPPPSTDIFRPPSRAPPRFT